MKFRQLLCILLCALCLLLAACQPTQPVEPDQPDPGPSEQEPGDQPGDQSGDQEPEETPYLTPVLRVVTENSAEIVSKEEYVNAQVTLTDSEETRTLDGVTAGIRGRGNYTWTLEKKGYRIKFDKKQAMLSDYKCKSWALLPNLTDKTLLRNYLAFSLAKRFDGLGWSSSVNLVELYLNGKYLGVYLLCDQTQVNENRLNIEEGSFEADTGYLIERDHYALGDESMVEGRDYFTLPDAQFGRIPYVLKSPEAPVREDFADDASYQAAAQAYGAQFSFIQDYITRVYEAIHSGDYQTFLSLCDAESFADYFLLDQILGNYEIARFSSFYMYRDKGGKLKLGPVWDYDICGGYGFPNPNLLIMESDWFLALYQVPEFRALYCSRFRTYYPRVLEELDKLDAVRDANAEAIARNNAVWPVETYIYPMTDIMKSFTTYEQHYEYFKDYVRARCDFLKRNLD